MKLIDRLKSEKIRDLIERGIKDGRMTGGYWDLLIAEIIKLQEAQK